ncbi:hypothetical protein ACFYNO_12370 [Kitasatospora sp. NPDC006697]|uniref:hypothetical protein n=1 Tax=Kitasatospora sp. NPDC006697 TaxID=3364020 RepID=UPI003675A020
MDYRNTAAALAGLALAAGLALTGCAEQLPPAGPMVSLVSPSPSLSPGAPTPGAPGRAAVQQGTAPLPPPSGAVPEHGSAEVEAAEVPAGPSAAAGSPAGPVRPSARPHPAPPPRQPAPAAPVPGQPAAPQQVPRRPSPAPGPAEGSGMCALAEQYGQLTPGSEQERLCRGVYGG